MRGIRTLRSMWRGLETWRAREASRAMPARQSPTLRVSREGWRVQQELVLSG